MKDLMEILKYLMKDKKNFIITTLLIIVETSFELIIPFLMKDIINEGVNKGNMEQILISGLLIIGCAVISFITGHLYSIFMGKVVSNYTYNLRKDLYNKIQTYSFSNLDNYETTSLITRVTNDCQIMQNTILGSIRPLFRAPIMLGLGVGLSFALAPSIAWIFILALPLLGIILFLIIHYTAPKYGTIQKNIDDLNLVVRENVVSIRTIKAYVREDYEVEKFNKANNNVKDTTIKTFKIAVLNTPAFQFSMYLVTTLLLAFGAIKVHNNTLEVGSLSALLSYVLQVMNSIMMISNVFLLMNRSFASASRINQLLKEEPSIKQSSNGLKVEGSDIKFDHVYFKYKETSEEYVLEDISLHFPVGSSIGIMGGTGSGKSTLVSLILRLYDVSEGSVKINDIDVKEYDLVSLRDSISIVLQNNVLFSGSVKENLLWGDKNATEEEINKALEISCSDEFIYRLPGGLDYDLGQGGVNVSGGQCQRLCIARALLKKPKIMIFDDSTSACDMETERKILKGIRSLKQTTNIIIGQRVTSVKDCDQIIILDEGRINAIGTHDELRKTNKIYQELCDVQLGGQDHD